MLFEREMECKMSGLPVIPPKRICSARKRAATARLNVRFESPGPRAAFSNESAENSAVHLY